jgi:hypothetical protein
MLKTDLNQLVSKFLQEGGKINKYYLSKPNKGPSLVYFKGWYRGQNIADAITKAYSGRDAELLPSKVD